MTFNLLFFIPMEERKLTGRVIRCTPQGGISEIDAVSLQSLIEEYEIEAENCPGMVGKLRIYLNIAELCSGTGYLRSAVKYYNKVFDLATRADKDQRPRLREFVSKAASGIERICRRNFARNTPAEYRDIVQKAQRLFLDLELPADRQ